MAGETAEIRQSPTLYEATPQFSLESKGDFSWPQYLARNIVVTQNLMGSGYIARMSINGQDMCCKIGTAMHEPAVQRELECLQKISTSQNTSSLRIPKLMGLVVDDDGNAIGFLEEFIPHESTLGRVKGGISVVPAEQREKWAEQIRQTVKQLHELGIVWGMPNLTTSLSIPQLMTVG
jgi:hypothetical protein